MRSDFFDVPFAIFVQIYQQEVNYYLDLWRGVLYDVSIVMSLKPRAKIDYQGIRNELNNNRFVTIASNEV